MKVGAHAGGHYFNDTTGCWYAAVCMLGYYRAPGPRLGVPEQYSKTKYMRKSTGEVDRAFTATVAEPMGGRYEQLKTNEGLVSVDLPKSKQWDCTTLWQILQQKGPCYVRRGFVNPTTGELQGGHAIVLVGANPGTDIVYHHCPTVGPYQEMSIADWNACFKWDDSRAQAGYSMMYLPPNRNGGRPRSNAVTSR